MHETLKIYCKSMGKVFRVRHIALNDAAANRYCERHKDCGVIAEDTESGAIFVAELNSITVKSGMLPD